MEPPAKKLCADFQRKQCLCDLGTGEVVHICHFKAAGPAQVEGFEFQVQSLARQLYSLTIGITDVRVCHPKVGEVVFVLTFISRRECDKFCAGPGQQLFKILGPHIADQNPAFSCVGTLMPKAHTLESLLGYLKKEVTGRSHYEHDINAIQTEMGKWFPRRAEYERYIHWDPCDPKKYTRNLIFKNEHMDVLLMCWPPHCTSAIHDHEESSCFVGVAEGQVVEVQYTIPVVDKNFLAQECRNPSGAIGRCAPLRQLCEATLDPGKVQYANNDRACHRVENRTDQPAYTLHVYAPGLRKMRIFKESGMVTVACVPTMSELGEKTGMWRCDTDPDGAIDVSAWNNLAA